MPFVPRLALALVVALATLPVAASAHASTTSVASTAQLQAALATAGADDVIELAGGRYPAVTLAAARPGRVTIRPAAGQSVTFADLDFGGSAANLRVEGVTVEAQVVVAAGSAHHLELAESDVRGVAIRAGSHDILVEHNDIHDCGNCVEAASVDPTVHGSPCSSCQAQAPIARVTVRGNRIVDPGTDAFYVGNFRDLVVEDNEIRGVTENGDHSDCLQSTFGGDGLVFRGNYVHDNRCQGFFIKDGRVTDVVVEDNLFARNTKPCGVAVTCDPGSPATFQVFDTIGIVVQGNTFAQNAGGEVFRERSNNDIAFDHNVVAGFSPYDDQGPDWADYYRQAGVMTEDHNVGSFAWTWPAGSRGSHDVSTSSPSFRAAAAGDYRLAAPVTAGGQTFTAGVSWSVADKRFGRTASVELPSQPAPPVLPAAPVATPPAGAAPPAVTQPVGATPAVTPKAKAKRKPATSAQRRAAARRAAARRAAARRARTPRAAALRR